MNIPNISSDASATLSGGVDAEAQDWKTLQKDLQQGDLSSAQAIFASMQQQISTAPHVAEATPPSPDSLIGDALHALQAALQKIDLSSAQSALVALQTAVKTAYVQTAPSAGAPQIAEPPSPPASDSQPSAGSTLNLLA